MVPFGNRVGKPHGKGLTIIEEILSLMPDTSRSDIQAPGNGGDLRQGERTCPDVEVGFCTMLRYMQMGLSAVGNCEGHCGESGVGSCILVASSRSNPRSLCLDSSPELAQALAYDGITAF